MYQADTWGWVGAQRDTSLHSLGAQVCSKSGLRGRAWPHSSARFTSTVWSFTLMATLLTPPTAGKDRLWLCLPSPAWLWLRTISS